MDDTSTTSIIIVDDHAMVRYGLKQSLLDKNEFKVIGEASTGREALELLSDHSPDVIIMDISMPGLNGIEATRQILKINPDIKIIALSMYAEKQYVLSMLKAGAKGYLLKTNIFEDLLKAIRSVVAGNVFLAPDITKFIVESSISPNQESDSKGLSLLTSREREIIQLIAEGKSSKEIGDILFISKKTVDSHRQRIMEKLDLHNIPELTKFAVKHGISDLNT